MKAQIRSKKIIGIIILCAVGLFLAVVTSIYIPSWIKDSKREEIPSGRIHDAGVFDDDILVHDSADGVNIIGDSDAENEPGILPIVSPMRITESPDDIWTENTYAGNHTMTEKAQMRNGSIGVLSIPKLQLSVHVYESEKPDNMEAMSKGVAHFASTSAFDGNVGLSAHNVNYDGSDGYFKHLHTLEKGDTVTYKTSLGERDYTVSSISTIAASDWSPLYYTDDHRITMITCISGQPNSRLAVQAVVQS